MPSRSPDWPIRIIVLIVLLGITISVKRDWTGDAARATFLREVQRGACDLFSTVLSPDYNSAHADHFHLGQAARGATGWRGCR